MIKSISLIIIPFILNIFFLGKVLHISDNNFFPNPIELIEGLAFFFAFGFGVPEMIAIILSVLILLLPSYIALFIYLKVKKNKK